MLRIAMLVIAMLVTSATARAQDAGTVVDAGVASDAARVASDAGVPGDAVRAPGDAAVPGDAVRVPALDARGSTPDAGGVRDPRGPSDAGAVRDPRGSSDAGGVRDPRGSSDAGATLDPRRPHDAGVDPRGSSDAGATLDPRGPHDAGVDPRGSSDAGAALDARGPRRARDAGSPHDAGLERTGLAGGPLDNAGLPLDDAGLPLDDAGLPLDDAGLPLDDAGLPLDDAGIDAPVDAGVDIVVPRDPVSLEPIAPAEPISTATTTESTVFAVKVIGGLIILLVLAYLGGHRRVVRFQERLGISGVIAGGFPFIALGVVASLPSVGILDGEMLENLRPVLLFGLGWLGFIVGAQLDIRVLERVPRGTAYVILVESLLPFVATAAACGAIMIAFGTSWRDLTTWRDVALLGVAASMTAPRRFRGFASRSWREGRSADVLLGQLDELVGVIGLLFITAYFRTSGAWVIPDTAWVFVALGLGVAVGALIFAMVRIPSSNAEFLAIVLGGIAFASGFAGYLRLSPIVICFVAGVLVTNFPNEARDQVFRILRRLERPVQMLFLIVAGAVWSVTDWRGWVLVPVFVAARVAGKFLGIVGTKTVLDADVHAAAHADRAIVTPLSVLSIAIVISAEHTYAGSHSLPWIMTAVIGGALVTEVLVQAVPPKAASTEPAPWAPPIDELDDSPLDDEPERDR